MSLNVFHTVLFSPHCIGTTTTHWGTTRGGGLQC